MAKYILTEIPLITEQDSFVIFERNKSSFSFPIHSHSQFELNYIENAKGAQRIVGDHVTEIDDLELVLITGSGLEHAWINHNCQSNSIYEITIQFNPDFFCGGMFDKKQFIFLQKMLKDAVHGIAFPQETIIAIGQIIKKITQIDNNFEAIQLFVKLMYELSIGDRYVVLSNQMFSGGADHYGSKRVKKVMEYLHENYQHQIRLYDVAQIANMSEASFCRFIKLRTGKKFIDCLNDIRISAAARLIIDEPTNTIADIAYRCGFNNLSNFNRIFRKKRELTPQKFREKYIMKKHIII